jgi:hypothetical protein
MSLDLLVQHSNVSDNKSSLLQCFLDRRPYRILGIVKFYCHPVAWLEEPKVFGETLIHELLIVEERFPLRIVGDGLLMGIRCSFEN